MKLFEAIPDEKKMRDTLTYEAWGEKLTLDQYSIRESVLRSEPWSIRNQRTWILKGPSGDHLSSCETYEMNSFMAQKGTRFAEPGKSIGIASVYTEPKLRKFGFARVMLEQLIHHFKTSSAFPAPQSLFLFSEIGIRFYERLGFLPIHAEEIVFPARGSMEVSKEVTEVLVSEWIEQSGVYLKEQKNPLSFYIWPEKEQLLWHWRRQIVYSEYLDKPSTERIGARVNDSFLLWAIDHKCGTLRILLSHLEIIEERDMLIRTALNEAYKLNLTDVRFSVAESEIQEFEKIGKDLLERSRRGPRSDGIPMILPLHPEIKPADWNVIPRSIWI